MTRQALIFGLLTTVAVGALATSALADPPGRVGRVATLDGNVSFLPPGADDWSWASRNYPVTDGESFWTGDDGRIELQVGAVDIRADSQTEVDVPTLRYGEMRLALPQGSLDIRVWRAPEGGVVVSTPAGDVRFDQAGLYRVDVGAPTDDGSYPVVEVTTLEGQAGAPSPEGVERIYDGEAAVLYAGYDPQIQDGQYAAIDDWGRELEARERPRYDQDGGETLTGYDDLAAAGDFSQDPQYGQVWYPRDVPQDWAPYRYGHWSYVEPWGYTWIDDQSWGFAPFHYGRWAQIDNRWAWVPGQRTQRPVYAPALVAFVGGVSWNFGGGGGAVGWVPLGPQEVYRPNYRVSDTYLRNVNINNVHDTTVINNLTVNNTVNTVAINNYRNARAATVVRAATFSGAAPVQRAAIPVSPTVLAQAPTLAAAERPAPSREARTWAPVAVAGRPAPPAMAMRPPERIAAVRAAVVAPPSAPNRPPVIAGARIAPPAPRPAATATAPILVAPAQVRNPGAQRAAAAAAPRLPAPSPARMPRPEATTAAFRPNSSSLADNQASEAAANRARAAQAAQAREAQATAARAADAQEQARAAEAQAAQQREAQAREAQMQAAQARASQAAAARGAEQAQAAAQEARMEARSAQARTAPPPPRDAPAAAPRPAAVQAQPRPAPSQDTPEKPQKEKDPNDGPRR